jgi:hypothetical protein
MDTPAPQRPTAAGYLGTPLPKKLGIKADAVVVLVGAPENFAETLGPLPENVTLRRQARGNCHMVLWFVNARKDLEDRIAKMEALAGDGMLWIIWRKQARGVKSDLNENTIRAVGLAAGLVDSKVCAVDAVWSGLRFTRRRERS